MEDLLSEEEKNLKVWGIVFTMGKMFQEHSRKIEGDNLCRRDGSG